LASLLTDKAMRAQIFPESEEMLADALRGISSMAGQEGIRYNGWSGFDDQRILSFLKNHPSGADGLS
jgi:hypothetical protein